MRTANGSVRDFFKQSLSRLVRYKEVTAVTSPNGNYILDGMNPSNSLIVSASAKSSNDKGLICSLYVSPSIGEWGVNIRFATSPFNPLQSSEQKVEIAYIERQ